MANAATTLTAKVDVFPVDATEVDPEMCEAAAPEEVAFGLGSYLDCMTEDTQTFHRFEPFEQVARKTVSRLRLTKTPLSGAEIVIRPARLYDWETFGWTLYAFAFGSTERTAQEAWGKAVLQVAWTFQLELASHLHRSSRDPGERLTGE